MGGLIFHLIAHTHWDREWYLPRAAFHARLVPVLDDLLARLQAEPAYRSFLLDGQTVLLEDYLRARPEREGDVRALVKTGRLQIGPWYVLADEQIPSGESLLRNLLLGAGDAERLGGRLDVLYSPDAFGHPAAWPALAREFGIRAGVLWRGRIAEEDVFRWAAPDGREVVTWQLPPQGYEIGAALPTDPERLAEAWPPVRAALVERARGRHVAVFVGADHHAARPDLPRLRDALAALEPEHAVRVSRLDEFLQGVATEAAEAPLHTGELRWSYGYTWTLQGVHGTRLPLKRRNSEAELWLERFAEPLAALARRHGGRDRRPLLDLAWRALVRGHFHDAIAGCASDAAAAALEARLTGVEAYAREITRGALLELIGEDPDDARERAAPRGAIGTLALWNPLPRPRGGVSIADLTFFRRHVSVGPPAPSSSSPADAADTPPFTLRTADGRSVALQVLDRRVGLERRDAERHDPDLDEVETVRVALRAPTAPGLGFATLEATPDDEAGGPGVGGVGSKGAAAVRGRSLVNRFVEIALEPTGALTLHDRRSGERFFDLLRLEDGGDAGDTYSYCPPVRDRLVRSEGPIAVRRLAAGPLLAALEARWAMPAAGARLVVMLHADSPIVRCVLEIDNHANNHRLRARLPTALTGNAVAGTAFGAVVRRPVTVDPAEFPLETPVATAPAHRFAAAAAGRRGLALLAPGFFEYEWTPRGDLILTLLRAVGELSRRDLPSRPGHAGWPTPTPAAQCPGRQRIELALVTVGEDDLARGDVVPQHWEEAFLPVRGVWLREVIGASPTAVDVTLEGTGLVASAVKPAHTGGGSGIILRCYNATGRPAAGAWRFGEALEGGSGIKTAHRVRADEREPVALVLEERGRTVRFTAAPGELVTIWVT
jgi:2-O-(6-phospho-alpha-D-mannosyl)-D-glycerate hydrolase